MVRIEDDLGGLLKGTPKVLKVNQLNYEFLCAQDGYFVDIQIKKIGIKRHFPLQSIRTLTRRTFTNEVSVVHVSKIALEDLIEFQDIKFEIVRGVYFNQGRHAGIGSCIANLFSERLIKKAEKNPAQVVYKLLMNSGYGKMITKEIATSEHFMKDRKQLDMFLMTHNNVLMMFTKIEGTEKYIVKCDKEINSHFNICHVGVEILDMSKRIMNEVMCLAEDVKIPIYYQDTDSMQLPAKKLPLLCSKFLLKYNRELVGTALGQFHSDYEKINGNVPVAVKSLFIAKKTYMAVLYDPISKGWDYHMRLKGIPADCIINKAKEMFPLDTEMDSIYNLYKKLYDGVPIEFDLASGRVFFKANGNLSISSVNTFTRKIMFDAC